MDYEKIYKTLIQIIADREQVVVTTKVERREKTNEKIQMEQSKICNKHIKARGDIRFSNYI